jgi:hypothetical protein
VSHGIILCWGSFMLSVTNTLIMLNGIRLNVVMLSVVAPLRKLQMTYMRYFWWWKRNMKKNHLKVVPSQLVNLSFCQLASFSTCHFANLPLYIFVFFQICQSLSQNDNLTKWHVDIMTIWQNDNLRKWQFEKMTIWENDNLRKWQFEKMTIWENDNLTKWQFDKMTILQNDNLKKWQFEKMTIWKKSSWQNDNLKKWQFEKKIKLTKWKVDKMSSRKNDKLTKWQVDKST